jgi:hypothetical protein
MKFTRTKNLLNMRKEIFSLFLLQILHEDFQMGNLM